MSISIANDYLCVDFPEAVTITSVATTRNAHSESHEVAKAFRRGLATKEMAASSGAAVRMDTVFDVPMALTTDYEWKPGDTLLDADDNRFNIYTATKDPTTAFWSFVVYNPKIAYDLRHEIDVYETQMEKDAASAPYVVSENLLYSAISARVQWQSEGVGIYSNRKGDLKEAIIYSSQRLYITHDCTVHWVDPNTNISYVFDIQDWRMSDRLDELMQIRVIVQP